MKTILNPARTITALAVAALLATPLSAGAATDRGFIVGSQSAESARRVEPLAVIELDNGDDITFTPVIDGQGRTSGVVVTGVRSAGRVATASVQGLADANPLELFVALSRPGASVPSVLRKLYGVGSPHVGQQGWARDMALKTGPSSATCPASFWQNQVASYGDAFDDDPFTSTWDGPDTKPEHWASFRPGDGQVYYELVGQADDVTAFYGSVLYCVVDSQNPSGFDDGVLVSSRWRAAGTGVWNESGWLHLAGIGDVYEHIYSPVNPFSLSAPHYDFQLEVHGATALDQFHIGATWVDGKPSNIQLAG